MQNYVLKFVVIGDSKVGKSQLAKRFCKNTFSENSTSTIGLEFATKEIEFERCTIKAQVWDTAGQERFDSMSKAFYRDAVGAFLIYDITNPQSLENLKNIWIPQLKEFGFTGIKRILIGNKTDVLKKDVASLCSQKAINLAAEEGMDYFETSALSGECVDVSFRRLILHVASLLPDVSVHLDMLGLPEGWLVVEEPEGNDSGNVGIKYRNYWTDEVTRMKSPPADPAPIECRYEYEKDVRKSDDAKKRKSISMHSIRVSEGSSESINISKTGALSTSGKSAVSAHLVPKTTGWKCANCVVM